MEYNVSEAVSFLPEHVSCSPDCIFRMTDHLYTMPCSQRSPEPAGKKKKTEYLLETNPNQVLCKFFLSFLPRRDVGTAVAAAQRVKRAEADFLNIVSQKFKLGRFHI